MRAGTAQQENAGRAILFYWPHVALVTTQVSTRKLPATFLSGDSNRRELTRRRVHVCSRRWDPCKAFRSAISREDFDIKLKTRLKTRCAVPHGKHSAAVSPAGAAQPSQPLIATS